MNWRPKHVKFPIGYCLDTCHSYAAGYEINTEKGLKAFIAEADKVLGLENVPVFHANDSKGALGSHLDRHANIGEGYIGMRGSSESSTPARCGTRLSFLKRPSTTMVTTAAMSMPSGL